MKWELLLIDDEPELLEALVELLTDDETVVTTASNGRDAFELLQKKVFNVVVSDVRMPLMTGEELLIMTRSSGVDTPFIFFTGHAEVPVDSKSKGALQAVYVRKPYFEKLSAEINSALIMQEFSGERRR